MDPFRGNLLYGDELVLENVEGIFYVDTHSKGFVVWGGSFDIPNYGSVDISGEQYVLELADGRRGKIHITGKTGLETVQIEFEGAGPVAAKAGIYVTMGLSVKNLAGLDGTDRI